MSIKSKVAIKCGKARRKVATKCGKARRKVMAHIKMVVMLIGFAAIAVGCNSVPSRSQTINVSDCAITVYGTTADCRTNEVAAVELITQAMSIENSGSESITPTADFRPDVDVSIPVNKANAGTSAAGGALESVVGAAGDWAASKIRGKSSQPASTAAPATQAESATQPSSASSDPPTSGSSSCPNGACNIR